MSSTILYQIANSFPQAANDQILIFTKNESRSLTMSEKLTAEDRTLELSLKYFKEIIGENRFHRAICDHEFGLSTDTSILCKKNLKRLFFYLMDIKKADIDELPQSMPVHQKFEQLMIFKNFNEFKTSLIDGDPELEKLASMQEVHLSGYRGVVQRVFSRALLHFRLKEKIDKCKTKLHEVEILTASLADREFRMGSVFHLNKGFFYVDALFIEGGACVAVLRDLQDKTISKIVCRGTASHPEAVGGRESMKNNLLIEIGSTGVKAIWPKLSEYLRNNGISSVEILGKSLGGAHAQELAILIEGIQKIKVEKLITCCSVGVGSRINNLFIKEILEKRITPFKIVILRNGGSQDTLDYVPAVGGDHLGKGAKEEQCKVRLFYIQSDSSEKGIYPDRFSSYFNLVCKFKESLTESHCWQMTLKDQFHWTQISDRAKIDHHLGIGNDLEPFRKSLAYGINIFSFGFFNSGSFESYYFSLSRTQ